MNILYLITKGNFGGAQRYVFDLATAAKAQGHTVAVATGAEGALTERLAKENVVTKLVPSMARDVSLWSDLRTYRELVALLKQERPDVVHLNSSKAAAIGILAARQVGISIIIFTAHGWAFNEARPWWQKIILKCIYAIIVYGTHRTICVSHAVRRDMAWLPFSEKKLVVIHNGIVPFPLVSKEAARAKLSFISSDSTWLGMIAELHPTKRIEDAIEALARVRTTHPNLALIVLGEGENRAALQKLVSIHGLEEHVFFPGFVAEAPSYLSAFDIFLMPSRTEALSYALLEAGYASLPVIATKVGGIPEVIQDHQTGFLVSPENPTDLALSIRTLLNDPEQASLLATNLNRRVREAFMAERMIAQTLAQY